jgi:hypothetical protein
MTINISSITDFIDYNGDGDDNGFHFSSASVSGHLYKCIKKKKFCPKKIIQ